MEDVARPNLRAVEVVAICISALSLVVAAGAFVRNELRWRAERKRDVRVLVRHDGMGLDIFSAETIEVEHVMWTGLDSPTGDRSPTIDRRRSRS